MFYHVTPRRNLGSIMGEGLRADDEPINLSLFSWMSVGIVACIHDVDSLDDLAVVSVDLSQRISWSDIRVGNAYEESTVRNEWRRQVIRHFERRGLSAENDPDVPPSYDAKSLPPSWISPGDDGFHSFLCWYDIPPELLKPHMWTEHERRMAEHAFSH